MAVRGACVLLFFFFFFFVVNAVREETREKENEKLWSFSSNFTIWKKIRNVDSMTVEKKKILIVGEEKRSENEQGKRQILLG